MENIGIASVAAITVIAYLIGELVKATLIDNKWIPIVCGFVGGALGIVGMLIMPGFPATDYITAVAVGIVSGLAATGADQLVKQLAGDGIDYKTGYYTAIEEKQVLLKKLEEQELMAMEQMDKQNDDLQEDDLIPNKVPGEKEAE